MNAQLSNGGPAGAVYMCSKNGWINEEIFFSWLQHFCQYSKPSAEEHVLLVADNHCSHKSLRIYNFCRKNFISFVTIPPHASHRLQPLDVTFYGSLKAAFNRECDLFMKQKPNTKITPYDLAALFNKAFMRTATIEKGVSGFSTTGIYPLDPNKFTDDDFLASTRQQQQQELPVIYDAESSAIEEQIEEVAEANLSTKDVLEKILPIPGPSGVTTTNRKKQHSEIVTSTPMKTIFEENEVKKQAKENKKQQSGKTQLKAKERNTAQKNVKRQLGISSKRLPNKKRGGKKNITFADSSSESDSIDERNLVDDELDDVDPQNVYYEPPTTANSGDICIICKEEGKDEMWYRCVSCGKWAHKECSGVDTAKNYKCDFCSM